MSRIVQIVTLAGALLALLFPSQAPGAQAPAQAGTAAPLTIEARLKAALEATVASDQTKFPGAILYVSDSRQGTWVVAAGVADIATGAPLAPDARFRAGSIIKPFVATVVLQLVEEGVLSLDDTMTEAAARRRDLPLCQQRPDHAQDAAQSHQRYP